MSVRLLECPEAEALLAERASGPIEAEDAAALERHLSGCLPCRVAADRDRRLFASLTLPPPGAEEEAALRSLPERALAAWHGAERRRRSARVAVLAAVVLLAVALPLGRWKAAGPELAGGGEALAADAELVQLEWITPTWDVDEAQPAEDDSPLLDTLALEGDGAFFLGDSG